MERAGPRSGDGRAGGLAGWAGWLVVVACLLAGPGLAQEAAAPDGLVGRVAPQVVERLRGLREASPPLPPGVPFLVRFSGDVGAIEVGTRVEIRGIPVGRVREVGVTFDTEAGTLDVPVVIELVADRLTVDGQKPATPEATYDAVAALVAKGLRARISPGGLLGGGADNRLDLEPDAPPAALGRDTAYPQIPTLPTRADELKAALARLTARIDALPLEELAATAGTTLVAVRDLVTGPELKAALDNLVDASSELKGVAGRLETRADPLIASLARTVDAAGGTAIEARRTIAGLDGTLGARAPFWGQVQSLLRELTGVSRALRLMVEYLERHPDAIIRGKSEQSP
jgi:paraquat-inducible protein B